MQVDAGIAIQLAGYLASVVAMTGTILWRIKQLESKVEKHNKLVERMVEVEQRSKSNQYRIKEIAIAVKEIAKGGG